MALGRRLGSLLNHCEQILCQPSILHSFKTLITQEASQDPIRRYSCLSSDGPSTCNQRLSRLDSDQRLCSLSGHSTVERRQCLSRFTFPRCLCVPGPELQTSDCCITNISTHQSVTSPRPSNVRENGQSVQGVANCLQLQAGQRDW